MAGLPKLPGFTFYDPTLSKFHLSQTFNLCNGYKQPKVQYSGIGNRELDSNSVKHIEKDDPIRYDPSLTYGRCRSKPLPQFIPHFALYDQKCLTFKAFFKQSVVESPSEFYRVRPVNIIYVLEDDTISVIEPRVKNSGLLQGKLVRRGKIPKREDGSYWHWRDLQVGKDLAFYGTVYHTVDCDLFTREYMASQGLDMADPEEMPYDPYIFNRELQVIPKVTKTPPADDKLRRFLEYDGKVLRFKAAWDDRENEYGELMKFEILYFLCDDTVAVKNVQEENSGRDPYPVLLRKTKLPKIYTDTPTTYPAIYLEKSDDEVTEYYQPKDFLIGNTIFVLGRDMLLYDCDKFTRDYFKNALCIEQKPPIAIEEEEEPQMPAQVPPHDGLGSLQDSLQNTLTFMAKPPKKDVMKQIVNANKNLRYEMKMDAAHPEDTIRRFILLYSLADGTCKIQEPPIKNSGILGGKYLRSTLLVKPGSDPLNPALYTPADFYIGATIIVFGQRFIITGADLYVYRYMQENSSKFPCEVIENIRNWMFNQGYLKDDLDDLVKDSMEVKKDFDETIDERRQSDVEKCLRSMKTDAGVADPESAKAKQEKILQEYEDSIKHTYKVPPYGILPVQKECAYPVYIGEQKDLSCTEDIEGKYTSYTPKHVDTPEEIVEKYYAGVLKEQKEVCHENYEIPCTDPPSKDLNACEKVEEKSGPITSEEDLPYEEEILRNPYSVKHWLRYIDHKKRAPKHGVNLIYERALKELPGSYKLWYNYLRIRRQQVKNRCITDPGYEEVNNAFERSLVFMHKMPRIWMDYCTFLTDQNKITRTRKVFDRALRALPVTQHHRIWPLYLSFVKKHDILETAVRVFRRYLKLFPENAEEYVEYLNASGRLDEGAIVLAKIVNDENFVSKNGKSKHQLWNELCELISNNPDKVQSLNVDAIIRGGLRRYTDQLGHLWNSLANYYVRSGLFDRARDIYEEAVQTVTTVRDFTQVFDAYAQFEELSLSKRMEEVSKITSPSDDDNIDLELRLARFEHLMERRLLLLNSVLLRQNPHNVQEWHKRVQLYDGKPHEIINTYTEAVQTVQPKLAVGKLHSLWVEFAKFYEKNGQVDDARIIFEKAIEVEYTKVDDLASVWCEWAEMEIRNENYEEALKLMHRATVLPARKVAYHDESETVQARLYKSLKVWSMYADLEESFGTFKSCKAVYDRIIDLKIATPQIIINYGVFLEENNYFEEAFRAYEKGISLFKWPNVYDIWNTYLSKFLKRYGGTKIERARDLFEQCLENCPPQFAKHLYLLYAKLEEEHGMARHAMAVYERATKAVPEKEMFEVFNIYIKRAAEIYGIPKTRQIYEKAIEVLPENDTRETCLRFADMETKLGEIDRARAIYAHCSQICDPRVTTEFWQTWKEFEVRHGNEDTMREMLRIKRSVQAMYNTQVNMMSAQMLSSAATLTGTTADLAPGEKDGMRLLEAKAAEMAGTSGTGQRAGNIMFVRGETQGDKKDKVVNPDEIDIDDEDEEEEEEPEAPVEQKTVPSEVFGSLKKTGEDENNSE